MTELSTDEVIMNGHVVAASESSHPKVHLALVQSSQELVARTTVDEDGTTRYYLRNKNNADKIPVELRLSIDDYPELKDIQFVVDTTTGVEEGSGENGANLVGGQCDGQTRVSGRGSDTVILNVPATATTNPVQVWAGWATGHEAVKLTHILEFHVDGADELIKGDNGNTDDKRDLSEREAEAELKQAKEKFAEKVSAYQQQSSPNKVKGKPANTRSNSNNAHRKDKDQAVEPPTSKKKKDKSSGRGRRSKPDHHHHERNDLNSKRERQAMEDRKTQRRSELYNQRDTLGKKRQSKNNDDSIPQKVIAMDTTWYFYGLGILVVGNLLAVQACTYAGRRGGDSKGRLSL